MRKDLRTGAFKETYNKICKLKGEEKIKALEELNERADIYDAAKDFIDFYPKLYTNETLDAIVKAKNNIEASNIMTSLRRKQGEYAW